MLCDIPTNCLACFRATSLAWRGKPQVPMRVLLELVTEPCRLEVRSHGHQRVDVQVFHTEPRRKEQPVASLRSKLFL